MVDSPMERGGPVRLGRIDIRALVQQRTHSRCVLVLHGLDQRPIAGRQCDRVASDHYRYHQPTDAFYVHASSPNRSLSLVFTGY